MSGWPFDQDPRTAVITHRAIIDSETFVERVYRDVDDDGWQFLAPSPKYDGSPPAVVGLVTMLEIDPAIAELVDLEPGWFAWRRSPDDEWHREKRA